MANTIESSEKPIADSDSDFEDIKEKARIPTLHGVAARAVEVLQRRMGSDGLSIAEVAGDMNLSKRTLQRRLQQETISFSSLLDTVHFNQAIDCLLKYGMSIEDISKHLGFSDRTDSFTVAFKRWAGLSPRKFRNLRAILPSKR